MATGEEAIRQAAAGWFARLRGSATANDRTRFAAWRDADPRHREAYDRLERQWAHSAFLRDSPLVALSPLPRSRWSRLSLPRLLPRPIQTSLLAGAGLAAALVGLVWIRPVVSPTPIVTPVGTIREIALDDGSRLTLDADSAVIPVAPRHVRLRQGRARFAIVHDAARPFIVEVGDTRIVDRGTIFDVDRRPDAVEIALLRGRVEVRPIASARPVALAPGTRISVARGRLMPVRPIVEGSSAWVRGTLVFDNAPLDDVLVAANRYSATKLVLADTALGRRLVTGGFRAGDPRALAGQLARLFSLDVADGAPNQLVLQRRVKKNGG